jgi:hypothetical protein
MLLFKEGSHSVYFSAKHLKNRSSIDDDWGCGLIFLCLPAASRFSRNVFKFNGTVPELLVLARHQRRTQINCSQTTPSIPFLATSSSHPRTRF